LESARHVDLKLETKVIKETGLDKSREKVHDSLSDVAGMPMWCRAVAAEINNSACRVLLTAKTSAQGMLYLLIPMAKSDPKESSQWPFTMTGSPIMFFLRKLDLHRENVENPLGFEISLHALHFLSLVFLHDSSF